jgi:CBS domain-containing protein
MIKARDIMTTDVITLKADMDIIQAAGILLDNGINGAPVIDDEGRVTGLLCQSDLVVQQKKLPIPSVFALLDMAIPLASPGRIEREVNKITAMTVSAAMTKKPVCVGPDTDLEKIAALMVDKGFHTLPVTENNRLIGVIGKADVLRTLILPGDRPTGSQNSQ